VMNIEVRIYLHLKVDLQQFMGLFTEGSTDGQEALEIWGLYAVFYSRNLCFIDMRYRSELSLYPLYFQP